MKKIKLGIIGPGKHFTKKILPILEKNNQVSIIYILRNNKNKFLTYKTTNKTKIFFKNKLDFVYISSLPSTHEKYLNLCINKNINIICEKPILTNLKKIEELLKKTKKKNLLIFEVYSYIFNKSFLKLKNLIKKQKIKSIKSSFQFPFLNKNNFRYKLKEGGFFLDSAVYPISLETFLLNNKVKYLENLKTSSNFQKNIPINGKIKYSILGVKRLFNWGTGLKYKNFLKINLNDKIITYNKIFTKTEKEITKIIIKKKNKISEVKFEYKNQFKLMFNFIFKNYKKNRVKLKLIDQILSHNQVLIKIMHEVEK